MLSAKSCEPSRSASHGYLLATDFFLKFRRSRFTLGSENPNSDDLPPSQPDRVSASEGVRDEVQQVMGAQIAGATPLLNGTLGSVSEVGPMMMDSEVRPAPGRTEALGIKRALDAGEPARASEEPGVGGTLRSAAGRVMANVAAKVQGVIPKAKAGSSASFLSQEEPPRGSGQAGSADTGFVTMGSGVDLTSGELQERAAEGLFSPQQAQRLREMTNEAPLLYAGGDRGIEKPAVPAIPRSASSGSVQAEAIQAEVRRQMHSYMVAQSELQQRVASLVEENQMLRQVVAGDAVVDGMGPFPGRSGWLSGLWRNIMGLVQQAPGKAPVSQSSAPGGWPTPPSAVASPSQQALSLPGLPGRSPAPSSYVPPPRDSESRPVGTKHQPPNPRIGFRSSAHSPVCCGG